MKEQYIDSVRKRGIFDCTAIHGPNMLFISFDMVPRELHLPGTEDLRPRTPNLDSLRSDGIFFQMLRLLRLYVHHQGQPCSQAGIPTLHPIQNGHMMGYRHMFVKMASFILNI